jgi:molecular chaperone GrpE
MKDQVDQAASSAEADDVTLEDNPFQDTNADPEAAPGVSDEASDTSAERGGDRGGEEGAAATSPPPDEPVQTEVERELKAELDALNDRHLRLAAEFENYRRRMDAELTGAWNRAQAKLLSLLTEALDDLQRVGAFEASNTTVEALIEGVDLVERKFTQALLNAGAEIFDPVGEVFDPNTMEAMMRVQTEDEEEDDIVQQVFQKGYLLKGVLVRPARVSVLKHE